MERKNCAPGVNFASYILLKFKLIQAVFLYLIQEPPLAYT